MTRLLPFVVLLALVSVACFGDDDDATPTATVVGSVATATRVPELMPSQTPATATATPPATAPLSAVWVYDIESGERVTLFEDERRTVTIVRFDGDTVIVRDRSASQGTRYDLHGNLVPEPTPAPNTRPQCNETPDGSQVNGRLYVGAACGLLSPDEQWMLYEVDAGEVQLSDSGFQGTFPVWDQWAVNLDSGESRLLQTGLVHCGGCDGRFGPDWSESGRFAYFPELVQSGRTFLHDFETAETRLLFEGSTEITAKPEWSPSEDLILYPGAGDGVVLEDPVSGALVELEGVRWPARFDDSGRYVYGPASEDATAVYDIHSASVVATLDGLAGLERPFARSQRVRVVDDTFVALLEWGEACEGASLYRGVGRLACVAVTEPNPYGPEHRERVLASALSPDGRWAAVARLVEAGEAPRCTVNPCGQATIEALYQDPNYNPSWRISRYEVSLIDTETSNITVLSDQAFGPAPPQLLWHEDGMHLLVAWPFDTTPTGP